MPAVAAGAVDAGLVIHEARFTFPEYGLHALADLGQWWEATTGAPIPLGAILARRAGVGGAAEPRIDAAQAAAWLRASVRYAWENPRASREYVLAHAQELRPEVVQQHIDLYVNEYTPKILARTGTRR